MVQIKIAAAVWYKIATKSTSLVNKTASDANESCVQIHIEEGNSYLFTVLPGQHNTKINLPDVTVIEAGDVFIQATALDLLTKAVSGSKEELSISVIGGKLTVAVPKLGSIAEALHHHPAPHSGAALKTSSYNLVSAGVNNFNEMLKINLATFADRVDKTTDNKLSFVFDGAKSGLFGQLSLSGYLALTLATEVTGVSFCVSCSLLKSVTFLLEDLESFELHHSAHTIKLVSSKGEAVLSTTAVNGAALNFLNSIIRSVPDSSVTLGTTDLTSVIKWQSYNAQDGDCITVESNEDKLVIKGERTAEASLLDYEEAGAFKRLTITNDVWTKALPVIAREDIVTIDVVSTEVVNRTEKIRLLLLVSQSEGYTSYVQANEPASLS